MCSNRMHPKVGTRYDGVDGGMPSPARALWQHNNLPFAWQTRALPSSASARLGSFPETLGASSPDVRSDTAESVEGFTAVAWAKDRVCRGLKMMHLSAHQHQPPASSTDQAAWCRCDAIRFTSTKKERLVAVVGSIQRLEAIYRPGYYYTTHVYKIQLTSTKNNK